MKQHFLLSARARTLSIRQVLAISEQEAFETFKEIRWGKDGNVACPRCGVVNHHYFIQVRKQWRCKDCNHTFSVGQLAGEIHIDGAYVNGHIRPKNKKAERVDRRLAKHQKASKRCVLVLRQRASTDCTNNNSGTSLQGAIRTLTFIVRSENQKDVTTLADKFIQSGSIIHADENSAYDPLHARYITKRVNHQLEYATVEGVTNNLAESYFSRFRRMQYGQTHKFGTEYLASYANEAAYREDTRRWSNGDIFKDILLKCLQTLI